MFHKSFIDPTCLAHLFPICTHTKTRVSTIQVVDITDRVVVVSQRCNTIQCDQLATREYENHTLTARSFDVFFFLSNKCIPVHQQGKEWNG